MKKYEGTSNNFGLASTIDYNPSKGYGLYVSADAVYVKELVGKILYFDTKEQAINKADEISGKLGPGLMPELNDLQWALAFGILEDSQEGYALLEKTKFANKYTMPAYLMNMILEKYGLKLLGWD